MSGGRLYVGAGNAWMDDAYTIPCTEPIILNVGGEIEFYAFKAPKMAVQDAHGRERTILDECEQITVGDADQPGDSQ